MSIDSPHEPSSGGKENSSGGALPRSLLAPFAIESPLNEVPSPLQQNVAPARLFANPTRPASGDHVGHICLALAESMPVHCLDWTRGTQSALCTAEAAHVGNTLVALPEG